MWRLKVLARPQVAKWRAFSLSALRAVKCEEELHDFIVRKPQKLKPEVNAEFLKLPVLLCQEWGYRGWDPLLLKRDCYGALNKKIDDFFNATPGARAVVVMGNSGVGKSAYCLYHLWYLLHPSHKTEWDMVILKYAEGSGRFYMFIKEADGSVSISEEYDPVTVRRLVEEFQGKKVWYLGDKQVPVSHWTLLCRFVLTCSPPEDNHYHFSKYPVTTTHYVPVWSNAEIMQLNDVVFNQDPKEVDAAFQKWGGVPRYVLANRLSDMLLYSAIKSVARRMVNLPTMQKEADYLEASHRVFHFDVNLDTCELYNQWAPMKLASDFVAKLVTKPLPPSTIDALAGGKAAESMRAAIFDTFFHRLLERGLPMLSMEMDEQGNWGPALKEELPMVRFEFVPNSVVLPNKLPPYILDCTIAKPESSSNKHWDVLLGRRIFQTAVSSGRNVKKLQVTEGLKEASEFLKRSYPDGMDFEFVYFVPRTMFDKFTPMFPGGATRAARMECVKKFTSTLNVKVKKMCLRVEQSRADMEALEVMDMSASSTCMVARLRECDMFYKMGLRPDLLLAISKCGFKAPTLVQQRVIPAFCEGKNVMEQAPPGSGCTTALCFAVLQQTERTRGLFQAVVLAPSQEAAREIIIQMRALTHELKTRAATSDGTEDWHILVGTPSDAYKVCAGLPHETISSISILALDDADEMINSFQLEHVRLCFEMLPRERQVAIFSKAAPSLLLDLVAQEMKSLAC